MKEEWTMERSRRAALPGLIFIGSAHRRHDAAFADAEPEENSLVVSEQRRGPEERAEGVQTDRRSGEVCGEPLLRVGSRYRASAFLLPALACARIHRPTRSPEQKHTIQREWSSLRAGTPAETGDIVRLGLEHA